MVQRQRRNARHLRGGFNSIQMAMRRPTALKAILAADATDLLFKEDVHYIDGIFHVDEFELTMDLDQGRSGAPEFSLDEAVIGPRMNSAPWSLAYMRQQRDGPFWHAPVRPLQSIEIPCFLIGGFQDGYRDSLTRMLEQVHAPLRVWIGPWNHAFPNDSDNGPAVEWRNEAVRWFEHWLKGTANGIEQEPRLVIYMQHWHPPGAQAQDIPGEWRVESWPPQELKRTAWYLQPDHQLATTPRRAGVDTLRYTPSAGVESGFWWGDLQEDQRPVDAYSLVYDSRPLSEPVAIFGLPRVELEASADAPVANWFARLEDVAPDGRVTLITGAGMSGAQRLSMSDPVDLHPGRRFHLSFDLHLTSWVFPKDHRIRLAISNSLWPMTWPTPYPMSTALYQGGATKSRIELPEVPSQAAAPPPFSAPEPIETRADIRSGEHAWPGSWRLLRDEAAQRSSVVWEGKTAVDYPWGRFDHSEKLTYMVDDPHPEAASVEGESIYVQRAGKRTLTWHGHLQLTSDRTAFHYRYTRELSVDGKLLRTRSWEESIPRDHQ